MVTCYEKIAINSISDPRNATVSNALGGETRSAMTTVILIAESTGYTLSKFAEVYDIITDEEIITFTNEV